MKIFIATVLTLFSAFSVFAQTQAEIIVPTTFLRKSPKSTAEKVQSVQKGEKIVLEKAQDTDGWYYVSVPNGKVKGWINGNAIRQVASAETQNPPMTVKQSPAETVAPAPPRPQPNAQNPPIAARMQPTAKQTATRATAPPPAPAPTTAATAVSPAPVVPAATPKEEEEVLRVDTEEVSLNVRVVDGNNRPVNNLTESHFEVYEDNVRQPITSLTTAEVPTNYALVVDNSRSLRSQLGKIAEAGKIIIGTNRPADESTVVRFVSSDKIEVIQDFTTDKRRLDEALDNLFVEGGQTAVVDAVYLTVKRVGQYEKSRKRDDLKRRAVVLVSDGDDRGSSYGEQQLFDLLRASDVQIYAVGFVNELKNDTDSNGINRQEKAKAFLTRLAAETGGKVYFPGSVDELPRIASDISSELRTQYLITYAPTNEQKDRSYRNIKVVVSEGTNREKRTAITRTGRTSGPEGKAFQQTRPPAQEQKP